MCGFPCVCVSNLSVCVSRYVFVSVSVNCFFNVLALLRQAKITLTCENLVPLELVSSLYKYVYIISIIIAHIGPLFASVYVNLLFATKS